MKILLNFQYFRTPTMNNLSSAMICIDISPFASDVSVIIINVTTRYCNDKFLGKS